MIPRLRSPLLRAGLVRAIVEALFVLVGLLILDHGLPAGTQIRGRAGFFAFAEPCCVLWCAVRLRAPSGPWRRVAGEGVTACALGLALFLVAFVAGGPGGATVQGLTAALSAALFLLARAGVGLWLFWDRLRRTRLRWALTHAHLTVVALGSALFGAVLVLLALANRGLSPNPLLVLVALAVETAIAIAVVLPPSALVSFVVARRATRRVESLAAAAGALRAGDYTVRVPVVGEDEIARLQADFNAMAAELDRAMRDLRAERDTVAALLRSRRELIAGVSHELRTPVATLRGYLESTRAHWNGAPPPTLREDVEVMERETIRLQTLIDDLFTLARADVARLELRPAPTDVGLLVRGGVETVAPLAWQSGRVEVVAHVAPAVPPALADAGRLEQALQNLLHNGIRHTPPGGIVAVTVEAGPTGVILQVADTGEGIAPVDVPRVWERFYRAGERAGGAGLGLALVKELTEAMGGTVGVESRPGEGARFTLRLPYAGVDAGTARLS